MLKKFQKISKTEFKPLRNIFFKISNKNFTNEKILYSAKESLQNAICLKFYLFGIQYLNFWNRNCIFDKWFFENLAGVSRWFRIV
ncbi:MAG: hypothetical protein ABIN61_05650 [candidate division WOR-3 bacterium]